jgi:ABC-type transport system involved in multi-copper enzyme maturation permease subunit
MLNNTFKKTIFEKRWMIVGWTIAIMLITVFRDTLGESLKDVPESIKGFMGDAATYQNLNAYIDVQLINGMVFLPMLLGIILCSGLIAGKEEQGVLQSLLAQPVKRNRAYLDMLLASLVIIAIVCFGMFLASVVSTWIISEPIDVFRMLQATFAVWLAAALVSVVSFALGAITSKRGFSGMIVGILIFIMQLITALAPSVKFLKYPNYISIFKYFNNPSVILNGLRWSSVLIMFLVTIFVGAIGYLVFTKRDIYQK